MACGCNKNRTSVSKGSPVRPGVYNRTSTTQVTAPPNLNLVKVQSVSNTTINEAGINSAKRRTQALRREAISRTFGK